MTEIANIVRRNRAFNNKWKLYELINTNPGSNIYLLSKKMDWTPGKVEYYVKKLVKDGMIKNSTEIVNGRNRKKLYAMDLKNFFDTKELKGIKKREEE